MGNVERMSDSGDAGMSVKQYETYLAETFIEWVSALFNLVSVTSLNLLTLTMP